MAQCPECGAPLRKQVSVIIDCPSTQRALHKKAIRSKGVKILWADWWGSLLYCTECGWTHQMRAKERVGDKEISVKRLDMIKATMMSHAHLYAERIAPVYRVLNWHWDLNEETHIPDKYEIHETLLKLIDSFSDNPDSDAASTGGLTVRYEVEGDETILFMGFEDEQMLLGLLGPDE